MAFDTLTASKIFDKLFVAIVPHKMVYVYTQDATQQEVIKQALNLSLTTNIDSADIILVTQFKDVPNDTENRVLFSTSYTIFLQNPSVIGAFYWNKGRIKIQFLRSRLEEKNILLPTKFEKFILDEL